jgi:hypothetical protein
MVVMSALELSDLVTKLIVLSADCTDLSYALHYLDLDIVDLFKRSSSE